jgi:lysophospholipase L1-like esterase
MSEVTRSRAALLRVSSLVLGTALALAVVELALRASGYDPLGALTDGQHFFLQESDHPDLGYVLVPGAAGTAWETDISINSHGFRDREYAVAKPEGVARIAVVGDSIAFGNGLPLERTFPRQLEERLRDRGARVEVLNMAVAGYDTLNEVALLEQSGLAFAPDLVVVAYCINDVAVHAGSLRTIRVLQEYGALVRASRLLQLVTVRMDRAFLSEEFRRLNQEDEYIRRNAQRIASVSADAKLRRLMSRLERRLGPRLAASHFLAWYASEARIGRLRFAFARLAEVAEREGFPVTLVIVPYLDERLDPAAYRIAYQIVAHEARRAGFRVVQALDRFKEHGLGRLRLGMGGQPNPLHPNADGHRILAEALAEDLARVGFPSAR